MTGQSCSLGHGSYLKYNERISGLNISTGNDTRIISWLNDFVNSDPLYYPWTRGIGDKTGAAPRYKTQWGLVCCTKVGDVQVNRTILGEIIFSLFGEVDSYTKRVPSIILTGTKEQICCFLRGYFSGDGSVHIRSRDRDKRYVISCASVNKALLEDIPVLLDRLGIRHTIGEAEFGSGYDNAKPYYKLRIEWRHAVRKFMDIVGS
jgi:intein/homing endonuclease